MMITDDENDGLKDISNRKLLSILMQEIADVRNELKEDFDKRFDQLDRRVGKVETKLDNLNLKVDRNHIAFMTVQMDMEERLTKVEAKVG